MHDLLLNSGTNPHLEERISNTRQAIRSLQENRGQLIRQIRDRIVDPDEASQAIKTMGVVLMSEGRRLGGLVATQRRQQ